MAISSKAAPSDMAMAASRRTALTADIRSLPIRAGSVGALPALHTPSSRSRRDEVDVTDDLSARQATKCLVRHQTGVALQTNRLY